jgi:hypothetical protein
LLVHELTHVVQAQQGRVPAGQGTTVSQPTDPLEREAAAAYDQIAPRTEAPSQATLVDAARPAPGLLLRAPAAAAPRQVPGRNISSLSWDAKLVVGFVNGFARAGGKGFTPATRAKIERDFKDPRSVLEIYAGLQAGITAGALQDLWDNVTGLVQVAGWLFWNTSAAGLAIQELKDQMVTFAELKAAVVPAARLFFQRVRPHVTRSQAVYDRYLARLSAIDAGER